MRSALIAIATSSEHAHPHIRTDAPREVKHFHRAAAVSIVIVLVGLVLGGCGVSKEIDKEENVRPPKAGVPAGPTDVEGIYRTIHQGVLQLRSNGSFVLIVPAGPGPSGGTFTLSNGMFTVRSDVCGSATGQYTLMVTGPAEAGKATLTFTPVRDDCGPRQHYLTVDPWVYANS